MGTEDSPFVAPLKVHICVVQQTAYSPPGPLHAISVQQHTSLGDLLLLQAQVTGNQSPNTRPTATGGM